MPDIFTPEKRSQVMARIRGANTKPELTLRSMLHRLGYRYTVTSPKNKSLPGRPDLVLPKYQTVIFVHGCFWHGHEHCSDFRLPGTRTEWWTAKIAGNRARDNRVEAELRALGWHVVTIWACALKTGIARAWLEPRLQTLLGSREGARRYGVATTLVATSTARGLQTACWIIVVRVPEHGCFQSRKPRRTTKNL